MMVMMVIKAYAWMVFDIEQFAMLDYIILYFPWIMFGRCLYKYTQGGVQLNISKRLFIICGVLLILTEARILFVDLALFMNVYVRAIWKQVEFLIIRLTFLTFLTYIAVWFVDRGRHKIATFIGDYSYDIYLVHNPWIVSSICLVMMKSRVPIFAAVPIGVFVSIVGSIIIALMVKKTFPRLYGICFGHRLKTT